MLVFAVSVITQIRILASSERLKAIVIDDSPYSYNTENPAAIADRRTIAVCRRKNVIKEMPERIYELLRTTKSYKVPAAHVLFDSWFSNPVTLLTIKDIDYFVSLCLNKTKYFFRYESKTLCQIYNSLKKRPARSKYIASANIMISHKDFEKPIPTVIVFARNKYNKKKWRTLISTNTSLSEKKIIELYGRRWDIEVFSKFANPI